MSDDQQDLDARARRERALALAGYSAPENDALWFERAEAFLSYAGDDEAKWSALARAVCAYGSTENMIARAENILMFLESGLLPSDPRFQEAA